jgi:DNA-binding beta-propeller fold protein YncE
MQAGPHHMMASRDGRLLYVGEFNQNTVGVIDTSSDSAIGHYVAHSNPQAKTHAVFVSKDGSTLYATNFAANAMAVLDASSGDVLWRLGFDGTPSEVLLSTNEDLAYVSIRNRNSIAVVDLASHTIIAEPFIGVQPDTLRLTPDGKTVVVGLRGTPAEMALLDTRDLSVRFVDLPGTTTGHQWLSQNGKYTFIALEGPGSVALVNNQTGTVEADYPYPGSGKPHGVFYLPDDLSS